MSYYTCEGKSFSHWACDWEGENKLLARHFLTEHRQKIISRENFDIPRSISFLVSSTDLHLVVVPNHKKLFWLKEEIDTNTKTCHWWCEYIGPKPTERENYYYTVQILHDKSILHSSTQMCLSMKSNKTEQGSVNIPFDKMKTGDDGPHNVLIRVTIFHRPEDKIADPNETLPPYKLPDNINELENVYYNEFEQDDKFHSRNRSSIQTHTNSNYVSMNQPVITTQPKEESKSYYDNPSYETHYEEVDELKKKIKENTDNKNVYTVKVIEPSSSHTTVTDGPAKKAKKGPIYITNSDGAIIRVSQKKRMPCCKRLTLRTFIYMCIVALIITAVILCLILLEPSE